MTVVHGRSGSVEDLGHAWGAAQVADDAALVEIRGITKRFGKVIALHDVNLSVRPGEFLTLLGPSGCGKTTLLRIIAGFERPSEGKIYLAGKDITSYPPERRPLNMAFQRYALFPHLNVTENIAFGLRIKRMPEADIQRRVEEALSLVRLEGLQDRMPHQLSGGQTQRVALARALVNEPMVLLLDEPLSALDRKIRQQMQGELRAIQLKLGTTFIYVTHDQEEAMSMSSRIALMCDGRITQLAHPSELYLRPACEFAADFVGDANMLRGQIVSTPRGLAVSSCGFTLDGIKLPGRAEGEPVRLVIRPEAIQISSPGTADGGHIIQGTVVTSSYYGFYWMHRVRIGEDEQELLVRELSENPSIEPGKPAWLRVDTDRITALPADG